jgi:aminoglycoside phosphotransferase (APT) family kinase protein
VHPDGRALLLDRAAGADGLGGLPDSELRSVAADLGACLGRLHMLDTAALALGSLALPPGEDATAADLALWREIDRTRSGAGSSPAVGAALANLAATVPAPGRPSLCHGDAGPGNFLHAGGRVTALLDWEFAHVGDPHDDLAWVVVRNQLLGRPLDAAVTFASWSATTGATVDRSRVEWFRALVLTRMLISCDASIAWAGVESPSAQVQVALQPFLRAAVFEALRRAGCAAADAGGDEATARAAWDASPIREVLGDPAALDDLGALS